MEFAEAELLRLQAQVARRDAELEACVLHTHDPSQLDVIDQEKTQRRMDIAHDISRREAIPGKKIIKASSLTRDEALDIMGVVHARNKQLEIDVKSLSELVSCASSSC